MTFKEYVGFSQTKKQVWGEAPWKRGGQNPQAEARQCRAFLVTQGRLDLILQEQTLQDH